MPRICNRAPAAALALAEATQLFPNRSKASDGTCASPKHSQQNPNSDHEPNIKVGAKWYESAFDLTDDKASGCDADKFAEQLRIRRDPRVKYVIAERRMFSSYPTSQYPAWTWRPYNGSNPHSSHVHVSILPDHIFSTAKWWNETESDDDMDKTEREWLGRVHHELVTDNQPKTVAQMLADIDKRTAEMDTRLRSLEAKVK